MKAVILTATPKEDSPQKLKKAFEDLKYEVSIINPNDCVFSIDTAKKLLCDGKEVGHADVVISRFSDEDPEHKLAMISHFEDAGSFMLNTRFGVELANNKLESQLFLLKLNLKTPRSVSIIRDSQLDNALAILPDLEFPVIVKTLTGCGGVGVIKADSKPSLLSIIQVLVERGVKFVIQEFVKNDETFRILTIGGKAVASMRRKVDTEKDFRSNSVLKNSAAETYEPSEKEIRAAELVSEKAELNFCALDYVLDNDGEPIIFEFNSSPGFETIEEANEGLDVGKLVAEFCSAKYPNVAAPETNPVTLPVVDGEQSNVSVVIDLEKEQVPITPAVEIETTPVFSGIVNDTAKVVIKHLNNNEAIDARVDTGATHSCIHGEDAEVSGNNVSFRHGNTTYRCPLTRMGKIRSSDGGTVERPIITLDIIINIKSLDSDAIETKNVDAVEFTITDRDNMKYDLLIGRSTLEKAGILVSSNNIVIDQDGTNPAQHTTDE